MSFRCINAFSYEDRMYPGGMLVDDDAPILDTHRAHFAHVDVPATPGAETASTDQPRQPAKKPATPPKKSTPAKKAAGTPTAAGNDDGQ